MKRNELLKLRPGKYLVLGEYDSLIILVKHENKVTEEGDIIGVCSLYDHFSFRSVYDKGVFISYRKRKRLDDDGEGGYYGTKDMRFSFSSGIHGMSLHGNFDKLYHLKLVSIYNRETIQEDIAKFKMHEYINEYEFVRYRNKKRIKERIKKN